MLCTDSGHNLEKGLSLHKLRNWKHVDGEKTRLLLFPLIRSISTIGKLKGGSEAACVGSRCKWEWAEALFGVTLMNAFTPAG